MQSTSDTGPRKRFKDKKHKKDSNPPNSVTNQKPTTKFVLNESIHVQKDVNVGGNILSKLIFVLFLLILGSILVFALSQNNDGPDAESDGLIPWLTNLINFNYFANEENEQQTAIDNDIEPEEISQYSYWDYIFPYFPFTSSEKTYDEQEHVHENDDEKVNNDEILKKDSSDLEHDQSEGKYDTEDLDDNNNNEEEMDKSDNNNNNEEETDDEDDFKDGVRERDEDRDLDENSQEDDNEESKTDNYEDNYSFSFRKPRDEHVYSIYKFNTYKYDEDDDDGREEDDQIYNKDDLNEEYDESDDHDDDDDDDYKNRNEEDEERKVNNYDDDDNEAEDESKEIFEKLVVEDRDAANNYDQSDDVLKNNSEESSDKNQYDDLPKDTNEELLEDHQIDDVPKDINEDPVKYSDENVQKSKSDDEPDLQDTKEEENEESTPVITKLGVGVALIFVAYTVIIRKWNNYVANNQESANVSYAEDLSNAESNWENNVSYEEEIFEHTPPDSLQQIDKNETLQEYLETPSGSESDYDEEEYPPNRTTRDVTTPSHEDSESYTGTSGSDVNDSDIEPSATFNRYSSGYGKANVTNQYDWEHKDDLDDADEDFDQGKFDHALEKYEKILQSHQNSVRARYGVARVLDQKAEMLKSNKILTDAITAYENLLKISNVPDSLLKSVADRVVNRMRFKGEYDRTVAVQKIMIDRFPEELKYHNDLVVTLMMLNRMSEAEKKLENILRKWPNDGLTLVHYGFVQKQKGNLLQAIDLFERGINTEEAGTQDGRFYFHLGDALQKLKRNQEAMQIYEKGVTRGVFPSKYQRSLYNVKGLTARPWWSLKQSTYLSFFKILENNWKTIRDEALELLETGRKSFRQESEQLREVGDWRQFELFSRGVKSPQCERVPFTCRIIGDFKPAASCRRGQVKFSIMEPGTHVWPHCGPTNCRLRAHLGLVVPSNVSIRVADRIEQWKEGKVLIFDDSFEHEVWHNGTTYRLILIVDVWHPELTEYEQKTLSAI